MHCIVERFDIFKRSVSCVIRVLSLEQTCGSAVPSVTLLRRQRKVKVNRTLKSGEGTVALLWQFCVFLLHLFIGYSITTWCVE